MHIAYGEMGRVREYVLRLYTLFQALELPKRLWNFNFAIFSGQSGVCGHWTKKSDIYISEHLSVFCSFVVPEVRWRAQPTTIMGIRASYKININKFCCAVMRWITLITVDGHPFYHTFGGTTNAGGWIALATPNKFHFPRVHPTHTHTANGYHYYLRMYAFIHLYGRMGHTFTRTNTIATSQWTKTAHNKFCWKTSKHTHARAPAHARHKFYRV